MIRRTMLENMSSEEFLSWVAFYRLEHDASDPEIQKNRTLGESSDSRKPSLAQDTPQQKLTALQLFTKKRAIKKKVSKSGRNTGNRNIGGKVTPAGEGGAPESNG